jgi:hypothetical protein
VRKIIKKALKDVEYMIDTGRRLDSYLIYYIAPRVPGIRDERAKPRFQDILYKVFKKPFSF